jgi:hypothetical protein
MVRGLDEATADALLGRTRMRSSGGERENTRRLLCSSCTMFSTEGARRWPPQQRSALLRPPAARHPLLSRSRWERTQGRGAALREQPRGPGSDQALPARAKRSWRRYGGPRAALACPRRPGGQGRRRRPGGGVAAPVVRQPGGRERRGSRGQPCRASPLPPGADGAPGGAPAAHAAGARGRWGQAGGARRAGAWQGRGRPPPAAPSTPAHAARADAREPAEHRAAGWLWYAPGVARGCGGPARGGLPVGRRAAARRLTSAAEAGVAAGPGPHGAAHAPGGGAAGGAPHPCRAGPGAGAPGDAPGGKRAGEWPPLCQAASSRASSGTGGAGATATGHPRRSHC